VPTESWPKAVNSRKNPKLSLRAVIEPNRPFPDKSSSLRKGMRRSRAAQAARRRIGHRRAWRVRPISGTSRELGRRGQLDVRLDDAHRIGGGRGQLVLQRILLNRAVILAQVVDAGIGL